MKAYGLVGCGLLLSGCRCRPGVACEADAVCDIVRCRADGSHWTCERRSECLPDGQVTA